jgi:digeranylgeranylglycerophospholipid reductase
MIHREVAIAGASFAGLAVARELPGRTVLIDPAEVGEGQTSACAAPVHLLSALGALEAVQQSHDALVIHTPGRDVSWPLPEPFCTFDYRACCRAALAGTGAHVMRAAVLGLRREPGMRRRGAAAVTSAGDVPARALVDCTGWRAALAGSGSARDRSAPVASARYFGLESEVRAPFPPGLHFYFWPEIVRDGYAWAFPAGGVTRVGVLSYRGRTRLGDAVAALLDRLGMPRGPVHGGFLQTGLRPPVVDGVFVVGDAAGHCLPLTGEGIRSAVLAGRVCGSLLCSALDGRTTLGEAAARYRTFVMAQRRRDRALMWATRAALVLPARLLGLLVAWLGRPGPLRTFMGHYLGLFAPPPATYGVSQTVPTGAAHPWKVRDGVPGSGAGTRRAV